MNTANLTKQQLEKEINTYENLQAVGVNDLRYLDKLYEEAEKRNYEIVVTHKIELRK